LVRVRVTAGKPKETIEQAQAEPEELQAMRDDA
jgi:hypothetical protein